VLIQSKHQAKIYNKSVECILMGYSSDLKAYQCWNKKTGCILVSRNVQFIEIEDSRLRPFYPGVIANEESIT
jgi:hypothetical protein